MKTSLLYLAIIIITLLSCSSQSDQEVSETDVSKPVVVVSNYPLKYFTERIAGSWVEVQFPAKEAGDPAYWQPAPEEIVEIQQADLIMLNGAGYEHWFKNVTLPQSKLVQTAASFVDQFIPLEETVTHSHGQEGEHEHTATAFTTWLDMTLAVEQARAIKEALKKSIPKHEDQFEENFKNLEKDLLLLDEELNNTVSKSQAEKVVFSHPVYQYMERRYNIKGMSVHWEPDQVPDEKMWDEFEHILEHHPAKWMIWEGEPDKSIVTELDKRGINSVVFDPCGSEPDKGDFLAVMRQNINNIQKIYIK